MGEDLARTGETVPQNKIWGMGRPMDPSPQYFEK